MRKVLHLSPTSLSKFYQDQTEYYLTYLAENRPPKFPQTKPMSIGSSFDAHVKSWLHERLFGKGNDPKFELLALFEAQVESQNRDWAYEHGKYVFEEYRKSGALADLMMELQNAIGKPCFELEVKGVVNGYREGVTKTVSEVTFLGKPDVFFINKMGAHVILDWKVNGYCSGYTTTPMQGYVRLREGGQNKGSHRKAQVMSHNGIMINVAAFLEDLNEDWARQLAIYGWLCGEDIGRDFVVAIDQVACKPNGERPHLRFAEHRLRLRPDFQWKTFAQAQQAWEIIHSDHFFRELSKEESLKKCQMLDGLADGLMGDGTENDKWFSSVTRGG